MFIKYIIVKLCFLKRIIMEEKVKIITIIKSLRYSALALFFFISCAGSETTAQSSSEQVIFVAVLQRNLVQTEKLLKEGSSPNSKGFSGNTLLSTACHAGNAEMVDLLLKYKADPNMPNKEGSNPLNFAFKPVILKS